MHQQTPADKRLRVHIRWMIRRDMADLLRIERAAFDFPWFEEDFVRCLRQRNCIGFVATIGEEDVVGFMVYEFHRTRLDLINFAVDPDYRGVGVGSQMLEKLIGKLSDNKRTRITLAVRETNLPAQKFFASHGFRAVNVLRDYYDEAEHGAEDAYLFHFRHPGDADDSPAPRRRR